MASRFILPFADVGNGISPSDGAELFFFEPGTSTSKDTFTKVAATIANTNPVVADSDGLFSNIFITGSYKVVLKDKNGVKKWEGDPVIETLDVTSGPLYIDTIDLATADDTLPIGAVVEIKEYATGKGIINSTYDVVSFVASTDDGFEFHDSDTVGLFRLKLRIESPIHSNVAGVFSDGTTVNLHIRRLIHRRNLKPPHNVVTRHQIINCNSALYFDRFTHTATRP